MARRWQRRWSTSLRFSDTGCSAQWGWQRKACAHMRRTHLAPLLRAPTTALPQSLLRCRWAPGETFQLGWVLRVATGVAAALEHLHYRWVCTGGA